MDRHKKICKALEAEHGASASELALKLGVTRQTILNDLRELGAHKAGTSSDARWALTERQARRIVKNMQLPKHDTECPSSARELLMRLSINETRAKAIADLAAVYRKTRTYAGVAEAFGISVSTIDRALVKVPALAAAFSEVRATFERETGREWTNAGRSR